MIGQGTLTANSNYMIQFTGSTLTVTPATPAVTVSDPGGTYTGVPIAATATVTGVGGTATPEPGRRHADPDVLRRYGHLGHGPGLGGAFRRRDVHGRGPLRRQRRLRGGPVEARHLRDRAGRCDDRTDVSEQLARLWTGRHLRCVGEFRRRHAGRDGHLRRRHHRPGHGPAERFRPGRGDDLDPEPGLADDHGDLQRR